MNEHNSDILEHIIRYCYEIKDARDRFGDSIESLRSDVHYRNSVAMCILQIGELTGHVTDDFKAEYRDIPWQNIKGMRNFAAHHYGKIDIDILFTTITERIPELLSYCVEILEQFTKQSNSDSSAEVSEKITTPEA